VDAALVAKVREALEGWLNGDVKPLERLLDPNVELLWWRTGEWDIHGKKKVMSLLRQRAGQRGPAADMDVSEVAEDALIVTRKTEAGEGELPATLITFQNGLIVKMHQFRSSEEALKAAPFRTRP
jgi:hypothetical protein